MVCLVLTMACFLLFKCIDDDYDDNFYYNGYKLRRVTNREKEFLSDSTVLMTDSFMRYWGVKGYADKSADSNSSDGSFTDCSVETLAGSAEKDVKDILLFDKNLQIVFSKEIKDFMYRIEYVRFSIANILGINNEFELSKEKSYYYKNLLDIGSDFKFEKQLNDVLIEVKKNSEI